MRGTLSFYFGVLFVLIAAPGLWGEILFEELHDVEVESPLPEDMQTWLESRGPDVR